MQIPYGDWDLLSLQSLWQSQIFNCKIFIIHLPPAAFVTSFDYLFIFSPSFFNGPIQQTSYFMNLMSIETLFFLFFFFCAFQFPFVLHIKMNQEIPGICLATYLI